MKLHVLVAWASPSHQEAVRVVLPPAATVAAAVEASGLVARYGIDLRVRRIGINGRVVQPDTLVRDGDRVEIYRPLVSDPKAARRERVNAKSQQITQVKSKKN